MDSVFVSNYCALPRLYETGHDILWLNWIPLRESCVIWYKFIIIMVVQGVFMQRPAVLTCCIVLYQVSRFYDKEVAMYSIPHILPDPTVDEHPPIPTRINMQYSYKVHTTDTLTTSVLQSAQRPPEERWMVSLIHTQTSTDSDDRSMQYKCNYLKWTVTSHSLMCNRFILSYLNAKFV